MKKRKVINILISILIVFLIFLTIFNIKNLNKKVEKEEIQENTSNLKEFKGKGALVEEDEIQYLDDSGIDYSTFIENSEIYPDRKSVV